MRAKFRSVQKSEIVFVDLDLIDPEHARYRVEPSGWQVQAMCACGWRSRPVSTGGMAGSMWDQHVVEAEVVRRN